MDQVLAGRGSRLGAVLIDAVPVVVLQIIATTIRKRGVGDTPHLNVVIVLLIVILGYAFYQLMLLARDGQTIGKKLLHIKIVDLQTGQNGGFVTNVLKRTFLNGLLSIMPLYAIVDALFIFRDDRRCLHDLIAGTKVVEAS